ncbi:hypothetical protein DID88_010389 [Monilinia fructigena]|uniref:Retrotransposon gag domain-containing protein n=1 Tax=Monilinia fructigena TaxID=38457 RepID=A0A395INA4_9HELO|nr:hypothetical protein DID88_010389 [Monilinia fructigena]
MTDAPKEITINETLKIALPDKYQGSRQELDTFLLQLEIYFRFNQDKFTEKESKNRSALKYATEFRRYAGTTKWDEVAIMSHYRKGLKPETPRTTGTRMMIQRKDEGEKTTYALNVEKQGHRAADCRSKKTGGKKGNFKPKFGKGQLNATFVSQEHPAKTEEN